MTAYGECRQDRGMCDSVLWKSGVYVCVFVRMCVEEGQGGAERCQTTKRQSERKMVFAKDEWVRKSEVIEKCRVRQRRHEGGRRWLGVVNDFARRSQTAFTWLGGVFVLTHHCVKHWRISHAFVKWNKKNLLHWLQPGDLDEAGEKGRIDTHS